MERSVILKGMIAKGAMTPGGYARRAVATSCPQCGRAVMIGTTAEPMSTEAMIDVAPLDPFGELVALTAGIPTWSLAWRAGRYEIDIRDALDIKYNPPGKECRYDVVASHRCGIDIPHRRTTNLRSRPRESGKPASHGKDSEPPY